MLTEKDYCDQETCVALKELGYNRGAYAYYFPNHKEDLIFNIHPMRGCSINEMLRGYNTYSKDTVGHELIDAPTMWEAQKWLREEKRICVEVDCCAGGYVWELCKAYHKDLFSGGTTIYTHYCEDNAINTLLNDCGKYDSYEEALLEGVKAAIKLLKEERK